MTTVSTNTFKAAGGALVETSLLLLSIGAFFLWVLNFQATQNPFLISVMGFYALGMLFAMPFIGAPRTTLGTVYATLFRVVGGMAYVLGMLCLLPYLFGVCAILAVHGIFHPHLGGVVLWLPVYLGLPAFFGYYARRGL